MKNIILSLSFVTVMILSSLTACSVSTNKSELNSTQDRREMLREQVLHSEFQFVGILDENRDFKAREAEVGDLRSLEPSRFPDRLEARWDVRFGEDRRSAPIAFSFERDQFTFMFLSVEVHTEGDAVTYLTLRQPGQSYTSVLTKDGKDFLELTAPKTKPLGELLPQLMKSIDTQKSGHEAYDQKLLGQILAHFSEAKQVPAIMEAVEKSYAEKKFRKHLSGDFVANGDALYNFSDESISFLNEGIIYAKGNIEISHGTDLIVIGEQDVNISHINNSAESKLCLVMAKENVDIGFATNCIIIAGGTIEVSHLKNSVLIAGKEITISHSNREQPSFVSSLESTHTRQDGVERVIP